jgi:predicted acylesterase/phospholipase RssA
LVTFQRNTLVAGLVLTLLAGCTGLPRNPVPLDDIDRAEIPGMSAVRAWGGQRSAHFQADLVNSIKQEPDGSFPLDDSGYPIYHGLALSGGGSNGAFGAGVLNGWTQAGTRPEFKVVTGISTGALIAPFAFLGSGYDEQLKNVYTTTRTPDILERVNIFRIMFQSSEAFTRTTPLERLIEMHFDADFLNAVAAAHNQGRRLYIGTAHMDAQRLVVWNMGAIANSGHPDALHLFNQVVLASSSIPAVFPPVFIEVEVDGQRYDEMHADGGTILQMFFHAGTVDIIAAAGATGRAARDHRGTLYLIRNGKLGPEPDEINRRLPEIADRALSTLIKYAAFHDLARIYVTTNAAGVGFRYIAIPDDFELKAEEPFDPQEMKRLFELGYGMGLTGTGWRDTSPRYVFDR